MTLFQLYLYYFFVVSVGNGETPGAASVAQVDKSNHLVKLTNLRRQVILDSLA